MSKEIEPYKIYLFRPKDAAYLWCLSDYITVEIITPYTSDIYTHPARPHRRYVVWDIERNKVIDVAECELSKERVYDGISL